MQLSPTPHPLCFNSFIEAAVLRRAMAALRKVWTSSHNAPSFGGLTVVRTQGSASSRSQPAAQTHPQVLSAQHPLHRPSTHSPTPCYHKNLFSAVCPEAIALGPIPISASFSFQLQNNDTFIKSPCRFTCLGCMAGGEELLHGVTPSTTHTPQHYFTEVFN